MPRTRNTNKFAQPQQPMSEQQMIALETAIADKATWLTADGKKAAVAIQAFRNMVERSIDTPTALRRLEDLNLCEPTERITSSMMAAVCCALTNDQKTYKLTLARVLAFPSPESTPEERVTWVAKTVARYLTEANK